MHLSNCVKFKRISRSAYEELLLVVQISLTRNSLEIFQGKPKDSALGIIARISTRLKKKKLWNFLRNVTCILQIGRERETRSRELSHNDSLFGPRGSA